MDTYNQIKLEINGEEWPKYRESSLSTEEERESMEMMVYIIINEKKGIDNTLLYFGYLELLHL